MGKVGGWTGGNREFVIHFVTYNIRNRRNGGLESELQEVHHANPGLRVLQETKVTDWFHTLASVGYHILATNALSRHCEGVSVLYQDSPHFQVEALQLHRKNVLRFQVPH